jgi:hypothetical protein
MPGSGGGANRRIAVVLGILALVVVGPIIAGDTAQSASRYSLTGALADDHSVDLGPYRNVLGVDRAIYQGHLRSDKAPGQPLLAVPVYLVGRAVGADPATHVRFEGDLGLWWVTLWSAGVPFALLLALMFSLCSQFASRRSALGVTIAFGLGSMLLPFAVNLFGHDLAAVMGFAAWLLVERDALSPRRALIAGVLAGAAVCTEYESGIILVVLAAYLVVRHRARIGWFLVGAAPPLGVLAWYQSSAFGAPWRTPSAYFAGTINGTTEGGYSIPTVRAVASVFFGNRGLWIGAPIALLALGAAAWSLRQGNERVRRHAVVGLAIVIPFIVLCAGWSGFALLEDPGPRFLIPALPFLAVPLAVVWDRIWRPALMLAAWGALIAVPATVSFLLLGIGQSAVPELPRRVVDGEFLPTIWSVAFGRFGIVLYIVSVAAVGTLAVREWRRATRQDPVVVG